MANEKLKRKVEALETHGGWASATLGGLFGVLVAMPFTISTMSSPEGGEWTDYVKDLGIALVVGVAIFFLARAKYKEDAKRHRAASQRSTGQEGPVVPIF